MKHSTEQNFINWAEKQLGGNATTSKESYGDQGIVYRFRVSGKNYFLKIGLGLAKERERLEWLIEKLPVPKVIGFTHIEDKDALLLSAIEGVNLAELSKKWPADKVIDRLVDALHRFHATDARDCPFGSSGPDKVLVHGDACLPNFIFLDDVFSGYIDLGDMSVGNINIDLSAAIWSLQYNLGSGYGLKFLKEYGIKDATDELVEQLRLKYEDMQQAWGL